MTSTTTGNGFIIGAPTSGTGKTTVALGVMRALSDGGARVAPFKTGPDYIDTQYHTVACRRPSVNLDTFFSPSDSLRSLFNRYTIGSDVAVVEGAMGLFDGYDRDRGSSADVARTLGLPVVLVVNAKSTAYSLAPLLRGFADFDPEVRIEGVIFNRVGSAKHLAMIRTAADDADLEVLGAIPASGDLQLPSRHLGLTLSDTEEMERFVAGAAKIVSDNVDLERLKALTFMRPDTQAQRHVDKRLKIAVARDMAFSFIYPTTLDAFADIATVTFFSPMTDDTMPADTDILYLPGGYPELYAATLSANSAMRQSIRDYANRGGRILAECGGLIYLCHALRGADGSVYPMADVMPMTATMEGAHLHLGYRNIDINGLSLRGHEFHYSRLVDGDDASVASRAAISDALGRRVDTRLYRYNNVIAGYTHLYLGDVDITKLWNK